MEEMYVAYITIAKSLAAAFVMGVGSIGAAFGQGMVAAKACENLGKYPESASRIQVAMMLSLGIIETSNIFCLILALIFALL